MQRDINFMIKALELAQKSKDEGEVPVGAIIVKDDKIISYGRNRREKSCNALYHAEIEAIYKACKQLNTFRLLDCEMFVTLEPCPMCAGAIINSRIKRVVFGAYDKKGGACGSVVNLFEHPFNHKPQVTKGILKDECGNILSEFFKNLRKKEF